MQLNTVYYQNVLDKFQAIETLPNSINDKCSQLTLKIVLEHYRKKEPIHINFQNRNKTIQEISSQLFIELANELFCNCPDFPPLKKGDILRDKRTYLDGKKKDYEILNIDKGKYFLKDRKNSTEIMKDYEGVIKTFIPIAQKAQNETLKQFTSFFEKLNGRHVHDFTPTYFDHKSVFIAPKPFYDSLECKNKIPTTYFPNPREDSTPHETKSIPALSDSIMYCVPKYKICYEKILQQGKKIKAIVVCDTEESEIEQIIQDKSRFGFNLIILTNNSEPIKYGQVSCWNWFKEEIEILNLL